jgi:hypothetical protein
MPKGRILRKNYPKWSLFVACSFLAANALLDSLQAIRLVPSRLRQSATRCSLRLVGEQPCPAPTSHDTLFEYAVNHRDEELVDLYERQKSDKY